MYKANQNENQNFSFYQDLGEDKEYRNEFIQKMNSSILSGQYQTKDEVLLALAQDSRFATTANEEDYSKILRTYEYYENTKDKVEEHSYQKVYSNHQGFIDIIVLSGVTLLFGILCTSYIFINIM